MITRRQFLGATAGALLLAGCARAKVRDTTLVDFLGDDRRPGDPLWSPEARAYVVEFPARYLPQAKARYTDDQYASVALGLVALSIVCPKDRFDVGYCRGAGHLACPVCGAVYNRVGERLGGPTPRGLDRYGVSKTPDGSLVIDRARKILGPDSGVAAVPESGEPDPGRCSGEQLDFPPGSGARPTA